MINFKKKYFIFNFIFNFIFLVIVSSELLNADTLKSDKNPVCAEEFEVDKSLINFEQKGDYLIQTSPITNPWDIIITSKHRTSGKQNQYDHKDSITIGKDKKINPGELVASLISEVNNISPVSEEMVIDTALNELKSNKPITNELMTTFSEFVDFLMESKGEIIPKTIQGFVVGQAIDTALNIAETSALAYQDELIGIIQPDLESLHKEFAEEIKKNPDFQLSIEQKNKITEKIILGMNKFIKSHRPPEDELRFKGIVGGVHLKHNLAVAVQKSAKDVLSSKFSKIAHIKVAGGLLAKDFNRVVTSNIYEPEKVISDKVRPEKVEMLFWITARLNSKNKIPPRRGALADIANANYATVSVIFGRPTLNISELISCEGLFIEVAFILYGNIVNLNLSWLAKDSFDLKNPFTADAYIGSVSYNPYNLSKEYRHNVINNLAKWGVKPNFGFLQPLPVEAVSINQN